MPQRFNQRHRHILLTASSLVGSTAVTSILGVVYWGVAARLFRADAVGYASAGVSAFSLLGTLGIFGLGTLLISRLPTMERPQQINLFATAVWMSALLSGAAALAFGIVSWVVAPGFAEYTVGYAALVIFVLGGALTGAGIAVDNGLVGLLRGKLQFWRNSIFSISKLAILIALARISSRSGSGGMVCAWVLGLGTSFIVLVPALRRADKPPKFLMPRFDALRGLGRSTLTHHWLNLAVYAPRVGMPLLVTATLSATANASFYAAWLLLSAAYILPTHLSMSLLAVNSHDTDGLRGQVKVALVGAMAAGILGVPVLVAFAHEILGIYGAAYQNASGLLRILAVGYFANVLRSLGVTVYRVRKQEHRAIAILTAGGILEIVGACVGARVQGLNGLAYGLLAAFIVEGLMMWPAISAALSSTDERPRTQHA